VWYGGNLFAAAVGDSAVVTAGMGIYFGGVGSGKSKVSNHSCWQVEEKKKEKKTPTPSPHVSNHVSRIISDGSTQNHTQRCHTCARIRGIHNIE
jgi:polyferredoxin